MKQRKWIIVCAALLVVFTVFAGCTKTAGESTDQAQAAEVSAAPEETAAPTETSETTAEEPTAATSDKPKVEITMADGGVIVLELEPDIAPITTQNFIDLAEAGFYDGLTFHRVVQGFMIQGGDPNGDGSGGPGYTINGEFDSNGWKNDISHTRGVISMGRIQGDPNSAGSQFFITDADSTFLDGEYAAFGHVVEGMDVVDAIASVEKNGETPVEDVVIESVRVIS